MDVKSEVWRLMALVAEAQTGHLAPARPFTPWNAEQVEALWDNILNDWPLGPFVLVDVSASGKARWRGRIGPYAVRPNALRRLLVTEGAAKLAALAWSLADRPTPMLQRSDPEETALWSGRMLALDIDQRRVCFVDHSDSVSQRHLAVRLLSDAGPCLRAVQALNLKSVEREWVNRAARRLLEARCVVYVFPDHCERAAERMLTNYCRINDTVVAASL